MIRSLTKNDHQIFIKLMDEFYHSTAVAHPIPPEHYERIFREATGDSPYARVFLIESEGRAAGYGQVSLSFSAEAGGLVVWLEELYIRPQFQGKGLGSAYFSYIQELFAQDAVRFRLEVEPDNLDAIRLYRRLGYEQMPYLPMYQDFAK